MCFITNASAIQQFNASSLVAELGGNTAFQVNIRFNWPEIGAYGQRKSFIRAKTINDPISMIPTVIMTFSVLSEGGLPRTAS